MKTKKMGGLIADLRKERNIRQDELAEYIGVTAQAVSKWENGGMPDCELLPRIADFFGVSVDMLFGRGLSVTSERASEILDILAKYKQISTQNMEINDTEETLYRFLPSPSFTPCLFLRESLLTNRQVLTII